MNIAVVSDAHLYKTPDGKYWAPAIHGYSFWTRYLDIFDKVKVVAKVKKIDNCTENLLPVDGFGVYVYDIPFFRGPKQLLTNFVSIVSRIMHVFDDCDTVIFRAPGILPFLAYRFLPRQMPFACEIIYDPTDDLKNKNNGFFLKLIFKEYSRNLKLLCKNANGVSYVTKETIQINYPSHCRINAISDSTEYFETYYSSITLDDNAFTGARMYNDKDVLTVALSDVAMSNDRKGEKVLIKAVKIARSRSCNIKAIIIGDGPQRKAFEQFAIENGVRDYIEFTGRLASSQEVKKRLLNVDIFVFPTQAEGLPRGILESMAVGLPVISSPVGGIPEVLPKEFLIDYNDAEGYANLLCKLYKNQILLESASRDNFKKALEFSNKILQGKRNSFYKKLMGLVKEKLDK